MANKPSRWLNPKLQIKRDAPQDNPQDNPMKMTVAKAAKQSRLANHE